jgi:hypothetical protein
MNRWRRIAWPLIVIADLGLLAWGAMAALAPDNLLGPGNLPILRAEFEGFTGASWSQLTPGTASFITLVFRMYGVYGVAFGLLAALVAGTAFRRGESWAWWALLAGNTITYPLAMLYDWTTRAIGPFEATEYVALAAIYLSLAVTAPFLENRRAHVLRREQGRAHA